MNQDQNGTPSATPEKDISEIQKAKDYYQSRVSKSTKFSETMFFVYIIFMVIYIGGMSFFIIQTQLVIKELKDHQAYNLAQDALRTWKLGYNFQNFNNLQRFITDIRPTTLASCPFDYEKSFVYKFPSIKSFCACVITSGYTQSIKISNIGGECTSAELAQNCYTSKSQDAQELDLWRNAKRVCIKRDSTQSLFKDKTNLSDCIGGQSCGFGGCVTGGSCPITKVIVTEDSTSPGDKWIEVLGLGSERMWIIRENEGSYPIGYLSLSEYEFCLGNEIYGKTPGRKEFKLIEENSNQKVCSQVDETVQTIDSLGEETFLTNNNVSIQVPGFPRFSNEYTWKLGGKETVHWSSKCRVNSDYNMDTAEERLNLDEIEDLNIGYIVITGFSVLVALIIGTIDLIKRYTNTSETPDVKQHYQQKQLKSAILIIDVFAKLICFPIIGIQIAVCITNRNWYTDIVEMGCSTTYFYDYISRKYQDTFKELLYYYSFSCVLLGIMILLLIVNAYVRYIKKRKITSKVEDLNQDQEEHLIVQHNQDNIFYQNEADQNFSEELSQPQPNSDSLNSRQFNDDDDLRETPQSHVKEVELQQLSIQPNKDELEDSEENEEDN